MLKVYNGAKEMATDRQSTFWKSYKAFWGSFIYFLALVIVASVIHECGHAVAAILIGVPVGEIRFSLHGLVPMTSIPPRFATSNLTIFHYAGGFTSGLILIIVYFLYWYRRYQKNPTQMNWGMGGSNSGSSRDSYF